MILKIPSSPAPSLLNAHIRPGTHLACMGTDTIGKCEAESALLARAAVFSDEAAQSIPIGNTQHAVASGLIARTDVQPFGDVIRGWHSGRTSADQMTLFDGFGVGLQDPGLAAIGFARARERGLGTVVAV